MNTVMKKVSNPLLQLERFGQSVWLDYISRELMDSGRLDRMIEQDGLRGLTSNPAIFEKAISQGNEYHDTLKTLLRNPALSNAEVFERLAIDDIRRAADHFAPTYRASHKRDGYVSLEVSPNLAFDSEATVAQARRLWYAVDRANLMIKVPATTQGIPAIETLLSEGINVNVTLLFSIEVYLKVAEAYLRALEHRLAKGQPLTGIASVASFFVSRVDTAVDEAIDERLASMTDPNVVHGFTGLKGKIAVANARLAYQRFQSLFSGPRWQRLTESGAQPQRLLWASTSSKNPAYRDVMYVEELIGKDTVNTMPPVTMDAFREHGLARDALNEQMSSAETSLSALAAFGVDLDQITDKLLRDGVDAFQEAYNKLLNSIEQVRTSADRFQQMAGLSLPYTLQSNVDAIISNFIVKDNVRRLWNHDQQLWTNQDEDHWVDWLDIVQTQLSHLADLKNIMHLAEGFYFQHVVLLGMGGSSLAPELFAQSFPNQLGHPQLLILDTTDPEQIRSVEAQIDPARTAFIVASKSGTTLESNLLLTYFYDKVRNLLGDAQAAGHFAVITDPGTPLEELARKKGFRKVIHGVPGIGGRYSALSNFGMVPAAIAGINVSRLLRQAETMASACAQSGYAESNPGLQLGAVLGAAHQAGMNKITLFCSPGIARFGAWLEQLLAESTGKNERGLIPVNAEPAGKLACYDRDRLFVYVRLAEGVDPEQDNVIHKLRNAGHAVVQIDLSDRYDLGAEFFRWEFATAVAGSILGINVFNQPDVESSKDAARHMLDEYEQQHTASLPKPVLNSGPLAFFTAGNLVNNLHYYVENAGGVDLLRTFLSLLGPGDYIGILAYLNRLDPDYEASLQRIRQAIRDRFRVATNLGYGPRYLHSTGQAFKGGPASGIFLMVTAGDRPDLPIPDHRASFATVQNFQAMADFNVLVERGRPVLRVHLNGDTKSALAILEEEISRAMVETL